MQKRTQHTNSFSLIFSLPLLLALYILARSPCKNRAFHSMLLALTVTDLITTCAVVPVPLAALITNQTVTVLGGDALCLYISTSLLYSSLVTQFLLCGLAFERYMSIARPFHSSRLTRWCAVRTFLGLVYTFSAVVCALPLLGVGGTREYEPGTWCYKSVEGNWKLGNWTFALLYSLLMMVLFIIMVFSNFVVLFVLFGLVKKRRRRLQPRSAHFSAVSHEDQDILNVVIAITVITLCCVMPFTVSHTYTHTHHTPHTTDRGWRFSVFILNSSSSYQAMMSNLTDGRN
uniref:G-protein coupled receptors family 1 profile domain-containing protein n=1 Tax=Eptatretus burgeri TaxID=7764 RepID=A0A8C4Q2N6_EPTBU